MKLKASSSTQICEKKTAFLLFIHENLATLFTFPLREFCCGVEFSVSLMIMVMMALLHCNREMIEIFGVKS